VWECDVGYYRVTDRCEACLSGSENATTKGDDDSPWSCEYFRNGVE